jgi:lysophospholipase L1-like esterase
MVSSERRDTAGACRGRRCPACVPFPSTPFALAAIWLAFTLAACGGKSGDGATGPSPVPNAGPVVYTAIGASDAVGYGSSVPCVPFADCLDGRGYVQNVRRSLQSDGRTVTLTNLGVPGDVLSPTIQAIGNQYGRGIPGNFLQQEMPFVARSSTLVTIFAGGNDANAIGKAVDGGAAGSDIAGYIDQQIRQFGTDYAALVRGVRDRAPSARVVVLNLPNMAGLPYADPLSATQRRWLQRIAVGFSREATALTSMGVIVVDLMCDGRSYQAGNYSGDGFHPNDAGYAYIAGEVLPAVSGSVSAPRGDCGFMHSE